MRIEGVTLVRQSGGLNLCGEACVAMLANYELSTTYTAKQIEIKPNGMDTPAELVKMGERVGLSLTWRRNQYAGAIKGLLDSQRPVILLVQYGALPKRVRVGTYTDGHYLVAVGYDDTWIYYYDPLSPSQQGITWQELGKAWGVSGYSSTFLYSNRIPTKPVPEPIPPTGDNEMDEGTFLKHWVPFVRDQRRRTNRLLDAYVAKPDNDKPDVAMYDANGKLVKVYGSQVDYEDDGWKAWEDLDRGKGWTL